MSQLPYDAISQGPATIPTQNYGNQQHVIVQPRQQKSCTPRRTKIIVAIVILTILWIITVIVWAMAKQAVVRHNAYDRYHN